jgi:hypothetical protein
MNSGVTIFSTEEVKYKGGAMLSFKKLRLVFICSLFFFITPLTGWASDPFQPSYPSIPPVYDELSTGHLIAEALVTFPSYRIEQTNGYQVKAPNGTKFVVDNIVQPRCAFYGNYITSNDNGFLSLNNNTQTVSNIYIGEINFANCK